MIDRVAGIGVTAEVGRAAAARQLINARSLPEKAIPVDTTANPPIPATNAVTGPIAEKVRPDQLSTNPQLGSAGVGQGHVVPSPAIRAASPIHWGKQLLRLSELDSPSIPYAAEALRNPVERRRTLEPVVRNKGHFRGIQPKE